MLPILNGWETAMIKVNTALMVLCLGLALGSATAYAAAIRAQKSIDCSKMADAKGLHGKDRRVFRAKCLRGEPTG